MAWLALTVTGLLLVALTLLTGPIVRSPRNQAGAMSQAPTDTVSRRGSSEPAPATTHRSSLRALTRPIRLPRLPGGPTGPAHPALAASRSAGVPVALAIPAIGVHSALQPLARTPDGTLQQPSQWQEAGWYADGIRPGDVGPAVIAGHVDSINGPAIFYRLRELRPGDLVDIRDQDGATLHFIVDSIQAYPKATFPTLTVYGPTALPELRLITCTGQFDWNTRNYLDNLVVTAHLA
jgi:sortase (surface protein transpeptidase)